MLSVLLAAALLQPTALMPIAVVKHPPLGEMSGLAASGKYPGVFWTHNDSGDVARIFPIQLNGNVLMPPYESDFWVNDPHESKKAWDGIRIEGASNIDWEDITRIGDTLYVSDMGNNGNARRDLGIYVVPEPNPLATGQMRALKFIPVVYPDQTAFPPKNWDFDCEALVAKGGKLFCITKHRKDIRTPADGAKLYRLDSEFPNVPNKLKLLDSVEGLGGWVTGAAVSPDERQLAMLINAPKQVVWFFDISRAGDKWLHAPSKKVELSGLRQAEAIAYESNKSVIISNEQRDLFRLTIP